MARSRQAKRPPAGRETAAQTDKRWRAVIAAAEFHVHDGAYVFEEFPAHALERSLNPAALALVRDGAQWSQLAAAEGGNTRALAVVRFRFAPSSDATGFVGWLATHLRRTLGAASIVICGQSGGRIFDYWAFPREKGGRVVREIRRLRGETAR